MRGKDASGGDTPLMLRVFKGMTRWHSKADGARARQMYFGNSTAEPDENEVDGLVQFLLHDFRDAGTGRTLIEHYLEDPHSQLTAQERATLESMRDARQGLYEMHRIEPGRGVHMRDVFSGESFFVEDITTSREATQGDYALVRVQLQGGRYILAGNGTLVARQFLPAMKAFVAQESRAAGLGEAEFARAHSYVLRLLLLELRKRGLDDLQIVDREGDAFEFCRADYEVFDRPALLEKLRALGELKAEDAQGSTVSFAWLETGEGPRSVYGHIEVAGLRLRLETNSRTRLELGRGLLEFNAGRLLRHLGDSFQSVEDLKRRAASGAGSEEPGPVPSEDERRAILEFKARHYAAWPDERLPALKGRTPRQAVRTEAGRAAVRDLIRDMENSEAHEAKAGRPAFDFSILRERLGLKAE